MLVERNVPFHVAPNEIQVPNDKPEVLEGNEPEGKEEPELHAEHRDAEEPERDPEELAPDPPNNPNPDFAFVANRIYPSSTISIGRLRVGVGPGYHAQGGHEFYTSRSGNTFDMHRPPTGDCFNCGERHWRMYCPYARGNETIV